MGYKKLENLDEINDSVDADFQLSHLLGEIKDFKEPDEFELKGKCRICGTKNVKGYSEDTVFSSAFTSANRLSAGDNICWRCKKLADYDDFRRYHWIVSDDGLNITKDRQKILDVLLSPPDGRWMIQVVSDFLNKLNGWIVGQKLNISTDRYEVIYDKKLIKIENTQVREFTDFARKLRKRDIPKRIMNGNFSSSDLDYYDVNFEEVEKIKELKDKEVWNLVTKLVE